MVQCFTIEYIELDCLTPSLWYILEGKVSKLQGSNSPYEQLIACLGEYGIPLSAEGTNMEYNKQRSVQIWAGIETSTEVWYSHVWLYYCVIILKCGWY